MTIRSYRTLIAGLLALGPFVLVPEAAFAQCAMCRSAFASPEGQQLVAAFRAGILFLLAAPFASFAAVALLAVRRQRRRDAALRRESLCRARDAAETLAVNASFAQDDWYEASPQTD